MIYDLVAAAYIITGLALLGLLLAVFLAKKKQDAEREKRSGQ